MKNKKYGFTLVEILIGIAIFSVVITGGFYILGSINVGKVKLLESTEMTKEVSYFSEKLFNEIKTGGSIDYEEYFNRIQMGTGTLNGTYSVKSGFGNFGISGVVGTTNYSNAFYYCNNPANYNSCKQSGQQSFGEYAFQFIDYGNDVDGDLDSRGDDDDESMGDGPTAIENPAKELYLISGDYRNRTLIRWKWKNDPSNKPSSATCNITSANNSYQEGCIGTLQILKLVGKDRGMNHAGGTGLYDGIIDTWILDPDVYGLGNNMGSAVIAGSVNMDDYRVDIFPDTLSVKDFKVYLYPTKDRNYAWKSTNNVDVNPYLNISLVVTPSWKKRVTMKGSIPEINISTTINLSDYFSK